MHVVYKYYTNMLVNRLFVRKIGLPRTNFDGIHTESCHGVFFSLIFSQVLLQLYWEGPPHVLNINITFS